MKEGEGREKQRERKKKDKNEKVFEIEDRLLCREI